MEEYLAYIWGAKNSFDFQILIQIQYSKWSKEMVEALCYGGFNKVIGAHEACKMGRVLVNDSKYRAHRHITFVGMEKDGERFNDFWIYVQLPNNDPKEADNAVIAMLSGRGLFQFLFPWCRRIDIKKASETHVAAFEPLQNIKVQ